MSNEKKLIFEKSHKGGSGRKLSPLDVPEVPLDEAIPADLLRREDIPFPNVNEVEVFRHYVNLSVLNHHVDKGFYPLGSCTMKYNPKVNEDIASYGEFRELHPLQEESTVQGTLQIMYELGEYISGISGMDAVSLQPSAGAQGEFTGLLIIRSYFESRGDRRSKVIIPDSSHGTNPASVRMAGYETMQIASNSEGDIDLAALEKALDDQTAVLMLTNPNTLGLFEKDIVAISRMVKDVGAKLYMDGANMNALLGIMRPGDAGFDVVHFNLHKTFSTPHGGGGPGSGPVAVTRELEPFLPVPVVEKRGDRYCLNYDRPLSIGKIHSFYGNAGVLIKAYCYLRRLGFEGLKDVSRNAIINANYLKEKLKGRYHLPYDRPCMHEFVLSGILQKKKGVKTLDIAKRLLDFGFHAPTIYFPLIVSEALMIEPTETESRYTLDQFAEAMIRIDEEIDEDPETVLKAPHTTPVSRLDEVRAARQPDLRWNPDK
jgi:glycine dehydrogenase subunit 2